MEEGCYSLLDMNHNMVYSLNKKFIEFQDHDGVLLMIRPYSSVEKLQKKASEEKYKELLLSTLTHDIKTPLTIMHGNLTLLSEYVNEEGQEFYKASCNSLEMLDYYMQDINVNNISVLILIGYEKNTGW